jgi:polar amino acid transport system permease protein
MATTTAPAPRFTRRQRARAVRAVQYAVLVIAVVVFVAVANWERIREAFFDTAIIGELFPEVLTTALKNTVLYTACAFAFGIALGLVIALMRLSPVAPYRALAVVFVEFFRGLPALLVLIAFGYGIPVALDTELPGGTIVTITVALGLVAAAYIAETIRAGIQAVPKGQMEAARSLGMSQTRAMISIIIPQAFRIVLPPLTNELIMLTKDSSLVYLLGTTLGDRELAKFGRDALNTYVSMTPILVAGLAYLIITVPLGYVVRRLEAQQARAR